MWHVSNMWGSCKILLVINNIFDGDKGSYKKKLKWNATATSSK